MPKTLEAQIYFVPKSLKGKITADTDLDSIASIPLSVSINPQNYPDSFETEELSIKNNLDDITTVPLKEFSLSDKVYNPQDDGIIYPALLKRYVADLTTVAEEKNLCAKIHSTNKFLGIDSIDFSVRLSISIYARSRRKKTKSKDKFFFLYDYEISGFYNFYEVMRHNGEDMKSLNKINFSTETIEAFPDTYFIFYPDEVRKVVSENQFVISYPLEEMRRSAGTMQKEGLKCLQRICKMNDPVEESENCVDNIVENIDTKESDKISVGVISRIRRFFRL